MPVAGGAVATQRVSVGGRVRFAGHVAEGDAIVAVVRERGDALAGQRRTMVHQIDVVVLRPPARQIGHHQLGAADAVADSMLDVETDFHGRLFTSDAACARR